MSLALSNTRRESVLYRRLLVLMLAALPFAVAQAQTDDRQGLVYRLGQQLGLWELLQPEGDVVGLDLPATVSTLESGLGLDALTSELLPEGDSLGLNAEGLQLLRAVDEPAQTSATAVLTADGSLADARDQPALGGLAKLDPGYTGGQIQGREDCPDGDGDGVCDREDQCLRTPPATRVLANGCYLSGPAPLRLEQVHFETNSATLAPSAFGELDVVASMILSSSARKLEISGHTDSRGSERHNQALSEARAQAVVDYLVTKGVPLIRVRARGYGESKPLADNSQVDGQAINRRVELRIITL